MNVEGKLTLEKVLLEVEYRVFFDDGYFFRMEEMDSVLARRSLKTRERILNWITIESHDPKANTSEINQFPINA